MRRIVGAIAAVALGLAGCDAPDSAVGEIEAEAVAESPAEAAPEPDPVPETEPEPEEALEPIVDPEDPTTWDITGDEAAIRRAFNEVRLAFLDQGSQAGYEALAALAWPPLTGDEMLACDFQGEPPSYDDLDAEQVVIELRWTDLISDEGWQVPGHDRTPTEDGYRIYLASTTLTYSYLFEGQAQQDQSTTDAHVGIDEDGKVIWFPACDDR